MLKCFNGFAVAECKEGCELASWGPFGGEIGEFTVTSGGERGAESDVAETGRCSLLELCCRGRGTGGPTSPRPCGTKDAPEVDNGEDIRGMSSEARLLFRASSCACSGLARGLEGKRVGGVVGPGLEFDLCSNRDLNDDTGLIEASSVPSSVVFTMVTGVDLCYRICSESDFYAEPRQAAGLSLKQLQELKQYSVLR